MLNETQQLVLKDKFGREAFVLSCSVKNFCRCLCRDLYDTKIEFMHNLYLIV